MTNAAQARQLDQATMFGMATAATLDGASKATTRYQHGVQLVVAAPQAKLTVKAPAPKLGMHYTPKAPSF